MKYIIIAFTIIGIIALVIVGTLSFGIPLTAAHALQQHHQETACKDNNTSLDEQLALLPDFIKSGFTYGGGIVHLADLSIADILIDNTGIEHSEAGRASGVFIINNGNPEIWLVCPSALLHEFGHWFDYTKNWLSGSDESLEVYHAEKGSFAANIDREQHYISTPAEYFAESFARYLENPDTLKKYCPVTHDYISNLIQSS
jgi:hypothetical protein